MADVMNAYPIMAYAKFSNNEKTNHKKIVFSYFESTLKVALFGSESDGKFAKKPTAQAYLSDLAYKPHLFYAACKEILNKIEKLNRGENIDREHGSVLFHNGKEGYSSATSVVSMGAYVKTNGDERQIITYISVTNRPKDGKKEDTVTDTIYLNNSKLKGVMYKGDAPYYNENYYVFATLCKIMETHVDRNNPSLNAYWEKVSKSKDGTAASSDNAEPSKSSNASNIDDADDEFPF